MPTPADLQPNTPETLAAQNTGEHVLLNLESVSLRRIKTGISMVRRPGVDYAAEIRSRLIPGPPKAVDVRITNRRVAFGSTTYAVSNIASISFREAAKNTGCALALAGLGVTLVLCNVAYNAGLALVSMGLGGGEATGGWMLWGALALGLAVLAYVMAKPSFAVYINANSGEVDGFMAHESKDIKRIHDAIQGALADNLFPQGVAQK